MKSGKRQRRKVRKPATGRNVKPNRAAVVKKVNSRNELIRSELKNFGSDRLAYPDFAADIDAAFQQVENFPKSSIENCRTMLVRTIPLLEAKFGLAEKFDQTSARLSWHSRIDRLRSQDGISRLSAIMMHSLLNVRDEAIYREAQLGPSEARAAIYLLGCAVRGIVPTTQNDGREREAIIRARKIESEDRT